MGSYREFECRYIGVVIKTERQISFGFENKRQDKLVTILLIFNKNAYYIS